MENSNQQKKILLAEDDSTLAEMLIYLLERQGCTVSHANNGSAALDLLAAERPDLVLLDIIMPQLSGYEVLRHIRKTADFKTLPVIMLTSQSQGKDVTEALEAGANDYIVKPFDPEELVARVKLLL